MSLMWSSFKYSLLLRKQCLNSYYVSMLPRYKEDTHTRKWHRSWQNISCLYERHFMFIWEKITTIQPVISVNSQASSLIHPFSSYTSILPNNQLVNHQLLSVQLLNGPRTCPLSTFPSLLPLPMFEYNNSWSLVLPFLPWVKSFFHIHFH
jgi:hypothetical protein